MFAQRACGCIVRWGIPGIGFKGQDEGKTSYHPASTPPQINRKQCAGSAASSTGPVATGARTATCTRVPEHWGRTSRSGAQARSRWARRQCRRNAPTASTETATVDGGHSGSSRTRGCDASTSSSGDGLHGGPRYRRRKTSCTVADGWINTVSGMLWTVTDSAGVGSTK